MATTDPNDFYKRKLQLIEEALVLLNKLTTTIQALSTCERHDAAVPDDDLLEYLDEVYGEGEDETQLFELFDRLAGERGAVKAMVDLSDAI